MVVTVTQSAGSPTLSVAPSNQNVTSVAGNTSFNVSANTDWAIASDVSWCSVTTSGSGNGNITATYSQNTTILSRVANITVTVSGLTPVVVTVTQAAGSPTLSVTPSNQNVGATSGNVNFNVTSNTSWTASINVSWCTVTTSGSGNGTLTAYCQENLSVNSRIANVEVSVPGANPVTVTITQSGATPFLLVTPENHYVSALAGAVNYTVVSNSTWSASSNITWCTVTSSGSNNGIIGANFEENTSVIQRIAFITISMNGVPDVNVTLTQEGADATISVNPKVQYAGYQTGSVQFEVNSNLIWTASSNSIWCNVTGSGNGNGIIVATYQENSSLTSRTDTIIVTAAGVVPVIVTLVQQGLNSAILNVSPPYSTVTDLAGDTSFNVSSDTSWTCSSDAPWCQVIPSGYGTGIIQVNYEQNLTQVIRTANILVDDAGLNPVSVQVIQLPSFVAIDEQKDNGIKIYPNPSNGLFRIEADKSRHPMLKVSIYNLNGNVLINQISNGENSCLFDLRDVPQGTYFIKVFTETDVLLSRMVIIE